MNPRQPGDDRPHSGGRQQPPRPPRRPAPHPGQANYPADPRPRVPTRPFEPRNRPASDGYLPPRTRNPHLPPLDAHDEPTTKIDGRPTNGQPGNGRPSNDKRGDDRRYDVPFEPPEKVTVARVMAKRSKYFTQRGVKMVHRAATADGADRSGLTALTLPVIANSAVDAAMAVALANTLFFAAATAESKTNVGLYLALTIAPFALIAPLIGPLLDRLQNGRRIAMASTFGLRAVLGLLIIVNSSWDPDSGQLLYKPWVLYPCALGLMVLSKSFGVLKSAVAPRVLPPSIDLPRVNSRLTTFGLIAGTIVGGGIAGAFELLLGKALPFHVPGAMLVLVVVAAMGAYYCMKIPSWVEVTEGEVPTTITYRGNPHAEAPTAGATTAGATTTGVTTAGDKPSLSKRLTEKMRQPLGRSVVTGLWGNGSIRILTGFLTLYTAFYAKAQDHVDSGLAQLMMLGAVGAAAGVGNALGNGVGTRVELKNPTRIVVLATVATFVGCLLAAIFNSLIFVVVAAFIGSGTSAIAKVCMDSSIQDDLPEASRASAFGRSETVLQLSWVFGASLGVLLPTELWIGFTVVTVFVGMGMVQTILTSRGSTLVPGFGGRRPDHAAPTMPIAVPDHLRR
ncbi:MFS transporter [Gordonia sp. (in: high G+C Gram-positive bacteria)]|uniref:MFS transporter n=1 Tax=Gordonia sp. (in: high G+C Gram-positive bacteria) TaxID=84139 RepID=UPI00169D14BA|nr:MFS transporter [Gordonia sp. (in: high G+C Gram-positive bacteria)]NLG46858.1 MFS transporter [Gordonia sp. (in: high G+C Gram-positive bacteria)]